MARLEQALNGFGANPISCGRAMRDLLASDLDSFLAEADDLLPHYEQTPGYAHLLTLLSNCDQIIPRLLVVCKSNRPMLPAITKAVQKVHPQFDHQLADRVNSSTSEAELLRCCEIIRSAEPSVKLFLLVRNLVQSPHARVRSKAALLLGRMVQSSDWFTERLQDEDPRVRANAIEALWEIGNGVGDLHLRKAAGDPNGRAAANAWVGLYLRGRVESLEGLRAMSQEGSESRRASACWAMGRTGDERILPLLKELVQSPCPPVRTNALRAMSRIRQQGTATDKKKVSALVLSATADSVTFALPSTDTSIRAIRPLDVRLRIANQPVLHYSLDASLAYPSLLSVILLPEVPRLLLELATTLPEVLHLRQAEDAWALVPYALHGRRPVVEWTGTILKAAVSETTEQGRSATSFQISRDGRLILERLNALQSEKSCEYLLYVQALAAAKGIAGMRGGRHMTVVLPAGLADDGVPANGDELVQMATGARVAVHVIHSGQLPAFWRELSETTKGLVMRAETAVEIADRMKQILYALDCSHTVRFPPLDGGLVGSPAELTVDVPLFTASAGFEYAVNPHETLP